MAEHTARPTAIVGVSFAKSANLFVALTIDFIWVLTGLTNKVLIGCYILPPCRRRKRGEICRHATPKPAAHVQSRRAYSPLASVPRRGRRLMSEFVLDFVSDTALIESSQCLEFGVCCILKTNIKGHLSIPYRSFQHWARPALGTNYRGTANRISFGFTPRSPPNSRPATSAPPPRTPSAVPETLPCRSH